MTVLTTQSRVTYQGNGTTVNFNVPYNFGANTWLVVELYNTTTGVITTLVLGIDYTVTGAGSTSGGTVTTTVAPATGYNIIISRSNVPPLQQLVYTENDPFPAKSTEGGLDYLTYLIQQILLEYGQNAIRFPDGDTTQGVLKPIPLRNNTFFYFDGNGNIIYTPTIPDVYLAWNASGIPYFPPIITGSPGDTFLQQGIGAVPRNFQSKVQEIFSVRDFGALGNGSTNDTAAIQACITAANVAGGNIVYFPPGNYITNQLDISPNIIYAGAGYNSQLTLNSGGSILLATSNSPTITLNNITIRDLFFNTGTVGNAIIAQGVKNFYVNNCYFSIDNTIGISLTSDVNQEHNYNVNITNCTFNGLTTEFAIEVNDCLDCNILNNDFEICSVNVITNSTASVIQNITIDNNFFNGNNTAESILLQMTSLTIKNFQNFTFTKNKFVATPFAITLNVTSGLPSPLYTQNILIAQNNFGTNPIMQTLNTIGTGFWLNGFKFINNTSEFVGTGSAITIGNNSGYLINMIISANSFIAPSAQTANVITFLGNTATQFQFLDINYNIFNNYVNAIVINNNVAASPLDILITDNKFSNLSNVTVNIITFGAIQGHTCRYERNTAYTVANDHNFNAWYTDSPLVLAGVFSSVNPPADFVLDGTALTFLTSGGPDGNAGSLRCMSSGYQVNALMQKYVGSNTQTLWYRFQNGAGWATWFQIS